MKNATMRIGAALLSSLALSGYAQSKQPNIILFLVDDMGWQDTSLPFDEKPSEFNKLYETPNMERLASQGMKFTQAYANSVSSPTRVSLFTGMNAARHRVTNWTLEKDASVDSEHKLLSFPSWNVNGIATEPGINNTVVATTLSQLLQGTGYHTIHCGKAHFAAQTLPCENPLNMGFDVNIAGHAAGGLGSYLGEQNYGNKMAGTHTLPWGVPGLEKYHGTDVFASEALTLEALAALDSAQTVDKPFFLYMAHYAVHVPIMADKRFYQKYLDKGMPEIEAAYASLVEGMDKSLGDIMDYLEKNNLDDNTVILFMSDNGGFSLAPRAGKPHTHNKPLNSGKGSAYEGGIREPMIVKWNGVTTPGSVCNDYLIAEDYYPTILEMAGVMKPKTIQTVDGESFLGSLKGKATGNKRALYWHFPNNWGPTGPGIGATSTIRKGDYKLIYFHENESFELYNISNDLGETTNLAAQNPKLVKKLAKQLGNHLRSVDAQMPTFKATGKVVRWPDEVTAAL
ncbi:MAG: sulfatase [Tannerellaceae bacterium]